VQRFEVPGVSNYTALLLSPDGGTLYLGARELLLAVNTSRFQPGAPARRVSPGRAEPGAGPRSPRGRAALGGEGGTEPALVQGSPPQHSPQRPGSVRAAARSASRGTACGSCPAVPAPRAWPQRPPHQRGQGGEGVAAGGPWGGVWGAAGDGGSR